jgi:translation initiation factor IF-3
LPTRKAINLAKEKDLDLVEVAPGEKPPVCKIMDYGKYRYKLNKKANEAKKKQKVIHLKEVKLRPKTEEHDYQFKLKHVNRFLADRDKAKITMMFRGREIVHLSIGQAMLERMVEDTKEIADVEQSPKREGRNMTLILTPKAK